jgi:transposase-like protein
MLMEHQAFERFKASLVNKASASQVVDLEAIIRDIVARQIAEVALARRTNATKDARTCPHCATAFATLHGKKNGRQRFLCRNADCRRTYNILTGTPMARARKPEKWGQYLSYMTDFMSVRKIILAGIGVNHVTVWRWRHRFLKITIEDQAAVLSGVIEGDETFFVRSFKGHRGWTRGLPPENRAARPSAWGATKRGVSSEQVPVLTALDTNGGVYWRVLGGMGEVEAALAGRIAPGSVLCSDGAQAYLRASRAAGAEHRRINVPTTTPRAVKALPVPTRRRKTGRLGLGRVNALHGQLKVLINERCRGVATRYLGSYVGWHRAMLRAGFMGKALLDQAFV